ncbi:MAG: ribonuclease J, partial [Candidatus Taylorbacteria bacterium]|nr:ribonuclease J [Candidatus Taylorbacteria bacterium]
MAPKIKKESDKENYSLKKTQPPKDKGEVLRLIPLGGLEEVGRNMAYVEYKDEIVIIDMGLQFPEEETPGIDFIIPNISALEPKKKNIRAVVITHGHYDHIGAIPYLIGKLGNPTIYTAKLSKAIIEKRQEEFVNAPKLNVVSIEHGKKVKVGEYFELEFVNVEHTIPDSTGVIVKTPVGNIVHFGDFRIDYTEKGEAQGLDEIKRIGDMGVHTFMSDSTNAEEPGRTVSERVVEKNLEDLFKRAEGRIILTTFASMLTRIAEIIKIAEKLGRKVVINGRSMKDNVQIAQNMGYVKAKKGTIISAEEAHKHKD